MTGNTSPHQPVLYQEVIKALRPQSPGLYIDATVGAGGHAAGILELSAPEGKLLGLDIDPTALEVAADQLAHFGDRVTLTRASYSTILDQMHSLGWVDVQGVLLDLGVSSIQLDTPEKGFSFQKEGPLDMRFDPENPNTAADLVNSWSFEALTEILWRYGEERHARRITKAIIDNRPLKTTTELAEVIARSVKPKYSSIHPATRTFQALRIAVNQELQLIESVLPDVLMALAPGGRAAVISFHSLEDRIVKQVFQREARDCICPPRQPMCNCNHKASIRRVNKQPIIAKEAEIQINRRSRSAKLRVAEKLEMA